MPRAPLHVWVLARTGTSGGPKRVAARFPQVTVTRVPVGDLIEPLPLVIGDLLPEVERAVLLPLPSVATADVAELADLDLGGHVLAAPSQIGRNVSGFGVIHDAAKRLGRRTDASSALRRTAHARHAFDFDAFRTDVLVVDLARARSEGSRPRRCRSCRSSGSTPPRRSTTCSDRGGPWSPTAGRRCRRACRCAGRACCTGRTASSRRRPS